MTKSFLVQFVVLISYCKNKTFTNNLIVILIVDCLFAE